jgi:hypothetical protein
MSPTQNGQQMKKEGKHRKLLTVGELNDLHIQIRQHNRANNRADEQIRWRHTSKTILERTEKQNREFC